MRKALRIISISAGLISVVSAVILGFIYLEDIVGHIQKVKIKIADKINNKKQVEEIEVYDEDFNF